MMLGRPLISLRVLTRFRVPIPSRCLADGSNRFVLVVASLILLPLSRVDPEKNVLESHAKEIFHLSSWRVNQSRGPDFNEWTFFRFGARDPLLHDRQTGREFCGFCEPLLGIVGFCPSEDRLWPVPRRLRQFRRAPRRGVRRSS